MGRHLNPSNDGLKQALNSKIYVDKTGILEFTNSVLGSKQKFMAVSRARRFGKSMAAELLAAYYSKGCDSRSLFKGLKAETLPDFEKELNKSNVIFFDFQEMAGHAKGNKKETLPFMQSAIIDDLRMEYPGIVKDDDIFLPSVLSNINAKTGETFIIIIDEWDYLFRERQKSKERQDEYISFLRSMFKGPQAEKVIKLAYLTGILPIKKYGTQSALNNFKEYTMVSPKGLAEYTGFSESEVKVLCQRFNMDFDECRCWYDGYSFAGAESIYNPNSVVDAMLGGIYGSYWASTDTYEVLRDYISMNFDGLRDDIISMLVGKSIAINPLSFQNDMVTINSKDDAMTLLVHLGYLAYDERIRKVRIPNREIAEEFGVAVERNDWGEVAKALRQSEAFLEAIIEGESDIVAKQLELVHSSSASVLTYNNENSLACAITIAFYTAFRYYSVFRELDSGKGFADMVYIPKPGCGRPALLIELKFNQNVDSAIRQIKEKRYNGRLTHYMDGLLMVGITYDKESKAHSCTIEKLD